MIYFPGGGYIAGNLDTEDAHCRIFATKTPCLVISVNYPKVPTVKLDDIINLGCLVVPWVSLVSAVHGGLLSCPPSVRRKLKNWATIRPKLFYAEAQLVPFYRPRLPIDSWLTATIPASPAACFCLQLPCIGNTMVNTSTCILHGLRMAMLALQFLT